MNAGSRGGPPGTISRYCGSAGAAAAGAPGAEGASAHGYLTLFPEPSPAVLEALRSVPAIEELQLLRL